MERVDCNAGKKNTLHLTYTTDGAKTTQPTTSVASAVSLTFPNSATAYWASLIQETAPGWSDGATRQQPLAESPAKLYANAPVSCSVCTAVGGRFATIRRGRYC